MHESQNTLEGPLSVSNTLDTLGSFGPRKSVLAMVESKLCQNGHCRCLVNCMKFDVSALDGPYDRLSMFLVQTQASQLMQRVSTA